MYFKNKIKTHKKVLKSYFCEKKKIVVVKSKLALQVGRISISAMGRKNKNQLNSTNVEPNFEGINTRSRKRQTRTQTNESTEDSSVSVNSVSEGLSARNTTQRNNNPTIIPEGFKLVPIDSLNSDSNEEQEVTGSSTKSKPKIQIFKGIGDKVSIENWLKRYEMIASFYKWSENEKVVMLGNHLEDDALNWYIENYDNCSYDELKIKLNNRFGLETVEPIVEFVNLKYDIKTGIKEYFENKRRFGILAKLSEPQMIPIMIQGLHPKMIDSFVAVKPKTFSEFYSIAKTAENNFKRNFNANQKFNDKCRPKDQTLFKPKKKPPNACKICESLGFKNRFHWAQDCRNKTKNTNQTQTKQINAIDNNSKSNEEQNNDILNINLN